MSEGIDRQVQRPRWVGGAGPQARQPGELEFIFKAKSGHWKIGRLQIQRSDQFMAIVIAQSQTQLAERFFTSMKMKLHIVAVHRNHFIGERLEITQAVQLHDVVIQLFGVQAPTRLQTQQPIDERKRQLLLIGDLNAADKWTFVKNPFPHYGSCRTMQPVFFLQRKQRRQGLIGSQFSLMKNPADLGRLKIRSGVHADIRLNDHIDHFQVLTPPLQAHQIDGLLQHSHRRGEFVATQQRTLDIDGDDDLSAHSFHHVHRQIVVKPSVHQQRIAPFNRTKDRGDGHGGPNRFGE
ncbi:MAG: hypothetical protein BWY83_02670 [bacterium ADurb.Bin478]|nr:MAG: hypothetical protein BWY83_02670 [bacterium ADurb.Bin478]